LDENNGEGCGIKESYHFMSKWHAKRFLARFIKEIRRLLKDVGSLFGGEKKEIP